jgi:hypothetical protein
VTFLAAAACLAAGRRSWRAAALLLAGGGLAHPPFLVHGIVVLAGAAALAWRAGARDEARDVVLAAGLGGLVAGAGVLATVAGPGPIPAETSKDAFLRRAGLDASLVDAYRERFRLRAARYVQWIAVPLAVVGVSRTEGFLRRFLTSWLVVMAIGIPLGWITGWFPPDRLVTFGFAVPIAAALGAWWIVERLSGRRALALTLAGVLIGWMIAGALVAWLRQRPFVSIGQSSTTTSLMRYVDDVTQPGTPVVVLIDQRDSASTFLVARAANILRAAAPPERVADLHVFLGTATDFLAGRPTSRGDAEFDAVSAWTLRAVPDGSRVVVAVAAFYRDADVRSDPRMERVADGLWGSIRPHGFRALMEPSRPSWGPASAPMITVATVAILAILAILGLGFAASTFEDLVTILAASPAFGAAAISLAAVALDAVGLRLRSVGVAIAAATLAGVGGLAWYLVAQRHRRPQAAV